MLCQPNVNYVVHKNPSKSDVQHNFANTSLLRCTTANVSLHNPETGKPICTFNSNILFAYLLTPWSRVLIENLTVFQLVKKYPAFYGTRRFITAFTTACQQSLSWDLSIQSIPLHPTSWRSILILSSHLRMCLQCGLFPSGLSTKTLHARLPHTCYMARTTPKYFLQNSAIFITLPHIINTYDPSCFINCKIEIFTVVII